MSITSSLLACIRERGSSNVKFLHHNSRIHKILTALGYDSWKCHFWQLISNRGSHKNKKEEIFMRENLWEKTKRQKRIESRRNTEESTLAGTDQTCSVLISFHLFETFPWKPSLILQLKPWTNYSHGNFAKVQTIRK